MCLHALQTEDRTSSGGNAWEFICSPWQNPECQPILHPRHSRHSFISLPALLPRHLTHLSSLFPSHSSRPEPLHFLTGLLQWVTNSLHLWSCLFYSVLQLAAIVTFLKYKSNHITPQMHILRLFSGAFYIKSDVLVGYLRPSTVWPSSMFSVHFLQLNYDGRHHG